MPKAWKNRKGVPNADPKVPRGEYRGRVLLTSQQFRDEPDRRNIYSFSIPDLIDQPMHETNQGAR
jgi:hypothetical protein